MWGYQRIEENKLIAECSALDGCLIPSVMLSWREKTAKNLLTVYLSCLYVKLVFILGGGMLSAVCDKQRLLVSPIKERTKNLWMGLPRVFIHFSLVASIILLFPCEWILLFFHVLFSFSFLCLCVYVTLPDLTAFVHHISLILNVF